MAELERKDLISDDALMAPIVLNKNFETLLNTILKVKGEVGKNAGLAESATSINTVGTAIDGLVNQEKELVKIQNQLASALAKDSDEYAKLKKKVDEANQAAKTRITLGERDALTINKQNASLKQLEAALNKNRQAYANLTNEEARNSEQGKKLLATIQSQDKDFKSLSGTIGKHQAHVGDYAGQLTKANVAAQALTPRLSGMANAIWAGVKAAIAFIATPLGATIALVSLALAPLISYLKSTGDGMDAVSRESEGFKSVLRQVRGEINSVGEKMFEWVQMIAVADPRLAQLVAVYNTLAKAGREYADALDEISTEQRFFNIEEAEAQNRIKELIIASKNRTLTEQERIDLNQQAADLEQKLSDRRIEFADQELAATIKLAEAQTKTQREFGESIDDYVERIARGLDKTDEELSVRLADALVKVKEAEGESLAFLEKAQNARDALAEKAAQEREKAAQEELKRLEFEYQERRRIFNEQYNAEQAAREKEKEELDNSFNTMAGLLKKRSDAEKAAFEKRKMLQQQEREATIIFLQNMLNAYQVWSSAILDLSGSIAANRIEDIDAQIAALDKRTEDAIQRAGDNDEAIAEIERNAEARRAQLEAKRLREVQRQAKLEKGAALIEAGIRTSLAILTQLAAPPAATAIPRSILAGVLGAIQVAAIAAKPIPQFATGTDNAPEGLAIVGEKGSELKVEPSGRMSLTPGVPTLDYLKAGTQIIPHKETLQALALSGLGMDTLIQRQQTEQVDLAKHLKQIEKNTRSKGGNLFKQGILTYEQKIKEDKSREYIRRSVLGR